MAHASLAGEPSGRPRRPSLEVYTVAIGGLTCAGEAAGLARRLRQVAGVQHAVVNPVTERAHVVCDPDQFDPALLFAEIKAAGYRVR